MDVHSEETNLTHRAVGFLLRLLHLSVAGAVFWVCLYAFKAAPSDIWWTEWVSGMAVLFAGAWVSFAAGKM